MSGCVLLSLHHASDKGNTTLSPKALRVVRTNPKEFIILDVICSISFMDLRTAHEVKVCDTCANLYIAKEKIIGAYSQTTKLGHTDTRTLISAAT